jgi:hypothetical protein
MCQTSPHFPQIAPTSLPTRPVRPINSHPDASTLNGWED